MGKTDCREVIEAFEAFLNAPETHRPEIKGALNHLRTCPACRGRASYLTRLLETGAADEDDLTCHECEELLPGYLTADGLGDTDARRMVPGEAPPGGVPPLHGRVRVARRPGCIGLRGKRRGTALLP